SNARRLLIDLPVVKDRPPCGEGFGWGANTRGAAGDQKEGDDMANEPLQLLIIGAHPDDADYAAGGTAALYRAAGHVVHMASMPSVPHLPHDPVIAYLPDEFDKPYPFQPSVAIDVGPVVNRIVDMLHCHTSQFYEWLPFNRRVAHEVPTDDKQRWSWLAEQI